jgi:hypothetical protein
MVASEPTDAPERLIPAPICPVQRCMTVTQIRGLKIVSQYRSSKMEDFL